MTLSKPVRILVGLATFWYALYLLLTLAGIVLFFSYIFMALMAGGDFANLRSLLEEALSLELMYPVHLCSLFLEVGLLIFYLVHTLKNTRASDSLRIALGLGHLFLPFVAMPVYYYLYIWRENPPEWASARGKVDSVPQNVV